MQQVWKAIPWLEVTGVVAASHTSVFVTRSLSSACLGSWCIGRASYDEVVYELSVTLFRIHVNVPGAFDDAFSPVSGPTASSKCQCPRRL